MDVTATKVGFFHELVINLKISRNGLWTFHLFFILGLLRSTNPPHPPLPTL